MRRFLTVVLLVLGGTVLLPSAPAWACSCAVRSESEMLAGADTVFVGTVVHVGVPADGGSASPVRVRLTVDSVDKGAAAGEVVLSTAAHEASCGYPFRESRRYRVFARSGETNLCSGNQEVGVPVPARTWADVVGAPRPARDGSPAVWLSIGTLVLTLGAVGVALLIRRRSAR